MPRMAGHSKWHNIRERKSKQDARRGQMFSKLSRELTVAVKQGGPDPNANPRLRMAIERARSFGMPQENIQRIIQRAAGGGGEAEKLEEITYEGYGPHGVAIMLHVVTDNRNRAVAQIRKIFQDNGGSLGETGCVSWLFERKGVILVDKGGIDEDELLNHALEAGADDVNVEETYYEIYTSPEKLHDVKEELEKRGVPISSAEISMIPKNRVPLDGQAARQVLRLMEALEEYEEVQRVDANFDIPDHILEEVAAG